MGRVIDVLSGNSAKNRAWLYFSLAALIAMTEAVAAVSARDPDGVLVRSGMILITVGAAMWLPSPAMFLLVPVVWLGPNYARGQLDDATAFRTETLLELPGLLGLAFAAMLTRRQLRLMEEETKALSGVVGLQSEIDEETGVYEERLLKDAIERELVRSRRFGREFAVMLAAIDPLRAKFDYREDDKWDAGFKATAAVLLNTRTHIDRVFRYGVRSFALLLPESGSKDITGLVRRLSRAGKRASPPEGEPGGPLPLHFGVTFFPQCAITVDDLLRRAEVALRIAEKSPNRIQMDGAEAPDMPPPELLRKDEEDDQFVDALAGQWLGAEAPEEEAAASWVKASEDRPSSIPSGFVVEVPAPPALEEDIGEEAMPEVEPAWPAYSPAAAEPGAETMTSEPTGPASVHQVAEEIAASSWTAIEGVEDLPAPVGEGAPADPSEIPALQAAGATNGAGAATAPVRGSMPALVDAATNDAMSDMLKRMDETLAMIRKLKAGRT